MNNIKIDNYYKPESKTLRLDEVDYTIIPNSDIKQVLDKLQEKNKQLQERIEYLERSNDRREVIVFEQSQKIIDLEDNWDMLKDFMDTLWLDNNGIVTKIRDKIKFIEQRGDSNE